LSSTGDFSDTISNLSSGTEYHYRSVTTDGTDTWYSYDVTFKTLSILEDYDKVKSLSVASVSGTPTISRAVCLKIKSGDDSTTGTGDIILDWTNISSEADIAFFDENNNLLDYYIESFSSGETYLQDSESFESDFGDWTNDPNNVSD
jgi:hypothetical protein